MPALRHWFHLTWDEIENMPRGELNRHLLELRRLPPIGSHYIAWKEGTVSDE